ncbi:hypothetical protein FSP39_006141 [Pinctada imbricata]|uniref:Amine oxidase domain-containing protein n=1 Tax=Pinctada imbricata TaxID=66713 RepID=A0AA88YHX4_PINIB|nr:hypothetical protein FSP39_006141 [Pinctada imbricata]
MTSAGPSVVIIGGGIAGLVCAARLGQLGINNVTVFDTGKNGPGGRCSSRSVNINGRIHIFDHSSQYFTVSDNRFAKIVSFLHSKQAIKIWKGDIGHLKKGKFEKDLTLTQAFVGTNGMNSVASSLASLINAKHNTWVSNVVWEDTSKKWKVDRYGYFDYLVIAHNGKCADKLMANAGVPAIHKLLQVRFSDKLNPKDQRMHLCSLWVLMVAFSRSLNLAYEGAHVDDRDISWIANNTAKLSETRSPQSPSNVECWTVISTKEFGSANKVPQENIPPNKAREVTNKMLTAFANVTGIKEGLPETCFTRVQLWGAAIPLNVTRGPDECEFDGIHNVGICGDWLVSPCIQGAAISGLSLAERIQKHAFKQGTLAQSTSLESAFRGTDMESIGCFPTDPKMIFNPPSK